MNFKLPEYTLNEKFILNEADGDTIATLSTGELGNLLLNDSDLSSKNWQAYFDYYWKDYKDVFERIGPIFYREVIKYGFDENHNPFIKYLKTILKSSKISNENITYIRYGAIHNAVLDDKLALRDLIVDPAEGFFGVNNIIFTNGYYTAAEKQCPGYLELQHKMEETLKKWEGKPLHVKDKGYYVSKENILSAFCIDYSKEIILKSYISAHKTEDGLPIVNVTAGKFLPIQQARTSFYLLCNQKPEENDSKDNKRIYEATPFIEKLKTCSKDWKWIFAFVITTEAKKDKAIRDTTEYKNNEADLKNALNTYGETINIDLFINLKVKIDEVMDKFNITNKAKMITDLLKYFEANKGER